MTLRACFVLSLIVLITGCTHIIRRDGYSLNDTANTDCQVVFEKFTPVDTTADKVIGKIKVTDSGFSFACGEDDALEIFKKEACGAGANVVNIIEEKRPDFISSCYRAEALLILRTSANDSGVTPTAHQHEVDSSSVAGRVREDHTRNAQMITGGILGGILAGVITALLFASH
jgi:hypothetical protein